MKYKKGDIVINNGNGAEYVIQGIKYFGINDIKYHVKIEFGQSFYISHQHFESATYLDKNELRLKKLERILEDEIIR